MSDDLEARLQNWGRVQRQARSIGHCGSVESQYRSPQRGHWERPVVGIGAAADARDAALIESAWATLPPPHRGLLADHYVYRAHPAASLRRLARAMGCPPGIRPSYGIALAQAQSLLQVALIRPARLNARLVLRAVRALLWRGPFGDKH